ncbi:MAG: hypothetical protein A2Y17_06190 [Clostridiales bacterium GWF2_38_85]|nr:MAG: hypothetical protein A2Y17_06190 [Clostridiales bacterium GWF2_38_85]HBL85481.1 DNA mismatch repair endonuclease MutL [Clostridiales bacterium]
MGIINLLDLQTANLIAAGEVVERAASVVKELCENSIDAKAKNITIEIKSGGNTYIRISDDGVGISEDDMPKTILRHATSKIKTGKDLDAIGTLGFRGEALAAVSSVARLTIISKQPSAKSGSMLEANDTDGVVIRETGCPDGTTIIVRDLFYNVPARRKFMKKDSIEAMAIAAVVEKLVLSHPEISFKLISDGEVKFSTSGDGKLLSAIYSVIGKVFASSLEEVEYEYEGLKLKGYISRPEETRGTRSAQSFFVNNRFIRSKTMSAALDEAFRSFMPIGRFSAAVLLLDMDLHTVDVNVHPSKLEVRFSNEKSVFDTVYYGVKSVLESGFEKNAEKPVANNSEPWKYVDYTKPQTVSEITELARDMINSYNKPEPNEQINVSTLNAGMQMILQEKATDKNREFIIDTSYANNTKLTERAVLEGKTDSDGKFEPEYDYSKVSRVGMLNVPEDKKAEEFIPDDFIPTKFEDTAEFRIVGEVFKTYIVVELPDSVAFIDKHAAHERILYEKLRKTNKKYAQMLFEPIMLEFNEIESQTLFESKQYLESYGFLIEKKDNKLYLSGIPEPMMQSAGDLRSIIGVFVNELMQSGQIPVNVRADRALYTIACKAAVKAGRTLETAHLEWIVRNVMTDKGIRYCPHGRPIMHIIDHRALAKMFGR